VAEVGLPPRGGLTGPRELSDRGTRFDRPEGAVEPSLPEHNPRLHQTLVSVLENFFYQHYNQMLAEPER
jgi:hypothetical protein